MFIDHITLAGADLSELEHGLAESGIRTEYGGAHGNGLTHMSMASFSDGSYLELVAPLPAGGRVALWHNYQLPAFGGAAWTIAANNVERELGRVRALDISTEGPVTIHREKPDGTVGEWQLAYLGSRRPGATLPFLIHDRTDRSVRVPATSRFDPHLLGWRAIVLAVHDIAQAARMFQRAFGWDMPAHHNGLYHFPQTPIYLASPLHHLNEFGDSPYACVLRSASGTTNTQFRFSNQSRLADVSVGWLDLPWKSLRLGVEIPE